MVSKIASTPGSFDPETTSVLSAALDAAWDAAVKSRSSLAAPERAEVARDILARHIIANAEKGERDPKKLAESALTHLARAWCE
jgi:hypothetical protein